MPSNIGSAVKETEVKRELTSLQKGLACLYDEVMELRKRLSPVLSNKQPITGEDKAETQTLAPLVGDLRSCCGQIENIRGMIAGLQEDLEI